MGQLIPRKYCKPGAKPDASPEPCVPVDVTVDLRASSVFIVSMQGEAWLEEGLLDENSESMEKMRNSKKEH